MDRRALILLLASACTDGITPDGDVVGKCAFASPRIRIEPGDVYLYVFLAADDYSVATGVATTTDSLVDQATRQPIDTLLPARLVGPARLEFGGLAPDRSGDAEHFVAMQDRTNMVFTSIGTTWGTTDAYPACAFRP